MTITDDNIQDYVTNYYVRRFISTLEIEDRFCEKVDREHRLTQKQKENIKLSAKAGFYDVAINLLEKAVKKSITN